MREKVYQVCGYLSSVNIYRFNDLFSWISLSSTFPWHLRGFLSPSQSRFIPTFLYLSFYVCSSALVGKKSLYVSLFLFNSLSFPLDIFTYIFSSVSWVYLYL